jgi:Ca2+-binding EF-hand superfamily protein
MRALSAIAFSVLCLALVFAAPDVTTGQPGGGGKKGGFGGGFDPGARFDQIANGKASIPVSEVRTQNKDLLLQFLREKGITNGSVTRQQYIDYSEYAQAARAKMFANYGKGNKGFGGGNPGGNPGGFGGPGGFKMKFDPGQQGGNPAPPAAPPNPDLIKQLADASFKNLDANGDGKLNEEEMPPRLKFQLKRWDKDGDGLIDINEYREYFAAQLSGGGGGGGPGSNDEAKGIASIITDDSELDKKVEVVRLGGKMPAGLPPWFNELDNDPRDGQVALNEWRAAGKDIEEFKIWDLNDDGFITPEEAAKVNLAAGGGKKLGPNGLDANGMNRGKGKNGKGGNKKGGGSQP